MESLKFLSQLTDTMIMKRRNGMGGLMARLQDAKRPIFSGNFHRRLAARFQRLRGNGMSLEHLANDRATKFQKVKA